MRDLVTPVIFPKIDLAEHRLRRDTLTDSPLVAVITGGNRGLGWATCRALAQRGYQVVLTSRSLEAGEAAARQLADQGLNVAYHQLDVTDPDSIRHLSESLGKVDVLVNNAAINLDERYSVLNVPLDIIRSTLETNVIGPWLLCQAFVPGMQRRNYGRVVNVSSGVGQLSSMRNYAPSYSASKTALNALTRLVADAVRGSNVLVNAVDPGWVRTDMGGPRAPRSLEQGIDTIVWLATLPAGGPTGGYFHDRQPIDW